MPPIAKFTCLSLLLVLPAVACDDHGELPVDLPPPAVTQVQDQDIPAAVELEVPAGIDPCIADCMRGAEQQRISCRSRGTDAGVCDDDAMGSYSACVVDGCADGEDIDPIEELELAAAPAGPVELTTCQIGCMNYANYTMLDCLTNGGSEATCKPPRDEEYAACYEENCCSYWKRWLGICASNWPA